MIMFIKRLAFVLLIVAVLSSLVGTAVAQSEPQQFVVVYVDRASESGYALGFTRFVRTVNRDQFL